MSATGVKTSPDFSIRRECNSVGATDNGQELQVCGWVYRYRDQGGVLFVDLRDRSGLVQVVFDLAVDAVVPFIRTLIAVRDPDKPSMIGDSLTVAPVGVMFSLGGAFTIR